MSDFLITKHALSNQRPCEGSITANTPAKHPVPIVLPSGQCLWGEKQRCFEPRRRKQLDIKANSKRVVCVCVHPGGENGGASTVGGVMVGVALLKMVVVGVEG